MNGINRILNIPLNFGISRQTKSSDRDPNQGGSYQRQKKERQPTDEEAKKAFAILLEMESIKRNNLQVELNTDSSSGTAIYVLLIRDASGNQLRGLRGSDILRLLDQGVEKPGANENGRILDRRI